MIESYLSLGSNMGDRRALIDEAVKKLGACDDIEVVAQSAYYETAPWGGVEQEPFLNIALKIKTELSAHELLDICQKIELALDRKRIVRWGPRTIDIDILTFGEITFDDDRLQIPHPRMFERAFVIVPLQDIIDTDACYGVSLAISLEAIEDQEIERLT